MSATRRPRPSVPHVVFPLLLFLAIVGLSACAGSGPGPQDDEPMASTVDPAPHAAELAGLHAQVRVPGLERRTFDPETYWAALMPVLEDSELLQVEGIGASAEGRPLRLVRFGDGPTTVLMWSQMHGDESTASMALADLFAFLAERPEHPVARTILESLEVHVIPMLNPDGAERFQRRNAQGIDVNRDARALQTPEGRVLKAVRDRVEPRFAFNLHDQDAGTRVEGTDRGVAIALLAPAFNEARDMNPVREDAVRVAGVIRASIEPLVGGHIARYDDTFNPRAFGDLMTQWGSSTILVESGAWDDDPEKQFLRRANFVGLLSALESIATGGFEDANPALYHGLPENGRRVGDLLIRGGMVAVPGLPPLGADVLVDYDDPLRETGGRIDDIGDLAGREARDTIDLDGLYLVPQPAALERAAGTQIQPGAPADFVVARDARGTDVLWRFERTLPPEAP